MPIIELSARQVYYDELLAATSKGTIIFVHGSGGTGLVWREQMKALSQDWDCVSIDLPGHGNSSPPACSSVSEAATLIKTFIKEKPLQKPLYLVGHSLGAAITLHYARYFSENLAGFILIGGGAKLKVLPQVLESLAKGEINDAFTRIAFSPHSDPALIEAEVKVYMQNSSAVLLAGLNACNDFNLTDELAAINLPALLIVGTDDVLTPVKYAEFLKNHLPDAILEILEAAGHFAMLEKPVAVNEAMVNFINKI
ncbi:MAG TPA: alpha/beta hydrolase [Syntrophomonadaceae bacterium]|nr:alpha/beta hydrolase [Syntrophomonadaceae bacterium]